MTSALSKHRLLRVGFVFPVHADDSEHHRGRNLERCDGRRPDVNAGRAPGRCRARRPRSQGQKRRRSWRRQQQRVAVASRSRTIRR
jgi:hypothetical protein